MKHWAIIFLMFTGLANGAARGDAPDGAAVPATLPATAAVSPTTEPAATAPATTAGTPQATTQLGATPDAATQPADANAVASTNPATEPTTLPVATTGPTTAPSVADTAAAITPVASNMPSAYRGMTRILPTEFVVLQEKSIFQKGDHRNRPPPPPGPPVGPTPVPGGPSKPPSAEDQLVFDGTTEAGTQTLAYVEDRGTSNMLVLQDGDKVATGTVSEITLDSLDYTFKGRVVHVQVGQNLKGVDVLPATDSIANGPVPTTQSSGAPGALAGGTPGNPLSSPTSPPAASGSSGASVSDIVARLKAKRARELGN